MTKKQFEKAINKCKELEAKYTIYTNVPDGVQISSTSYFKIVEYSSYYRSAIQEIDNDGVLFKFINNSRDIYYMYIPLENILAVEMFILRK